MCVFLVVVVFVCFGEGTSVIFGGGEKKWVLFSVLGRGAVVLLRQNRMQTF